ncbi:MAG TPA: hypothetical protein VH370_13085 [Humisphaera sp.]|nr:hypothetical protein [Humisphaera sp.]
MRPWRLSPLDRLAAMSVACFFLLLAFYLISFRWHPGIRFHADDGLRRFASSNGQIVLFRPPHGGSDDAALSELAGRMSNDDFTWSEPFQQDGKSFARGTVREASPTLAMVEQFQLYRSHSVLLAPYARVWLKALEDPRRCIPADMLLKLLTVRWRDANIWPDSGRPYVVMRSRAGSAGPDLSDWNQTVYSWHDELSDRINQLNELWLLVPTLPFPLLWLTRPRRSREYLPLIGRWIFNGATLASAGLFAGGFVIWHRSYTISNEWQIPPVAVAAPPSPVDVAPLDGTWSRWRWIGYSSGRVQFLERTVFDGDRNSRGDDRRNLWIVSNPDPSSTVNYVFHGGNWLSSSVRYYSMPARIVVGRNIKYDPPPPFVVTQPRTPQPKPATPPNTRGLGTLADLRPPPPMYESLLLLQSALMDEERNLQWEFRQLSSQTTSESAIKEWQQRADALAQLTRKNEAELAAVTDRFSPKRVTADMMNTADRERLQSMARTAQILQRRAIAQAPRQAAFLQRLANAPRPIPGARTIIVSMWLFLLPTLVLPLIWIRSSLRRRHVPGHACRACGYDMRATPQRCPECGTVPADKRPGTT